jgi:uncharacterized lipoprotein NlpE involved in copper resistance
MAAGYTELFLEQGATFNTTVTLDDVSGAAMNLVGYTASSQMKKSYYSSNSSAIFTATTGGINGTVTLNLTAAATANIYPGRYLYDVYVTAVDQTTRTRVLEGIVNVSPQVTKTPGML